MTDTGSGTIEFPAELLTLYLNHLPATFRVTGSEASTKPGTVLLSVVSAQLVGHGHRLTMHLIDEGMTRRAEVKATCPDWTTPKPSCVRLVDAASIVSGETVVDVSKRNMLRRTT